MSFYNKVENTLGKVGGAIGEDLGKRAGKLIGGKTGRKVGGAIGKEIGATGEKLAPLMFFKKGGRVPRTGMAMVHKNEFVLPAKVPPTREQKLKVREGKRLSV